jgi:hypothetical protein
MGDSKGFTSYFNLVDNFTQKFDAIQKRITATTNNIHKIEFNIGNNVIEKTKALGNSLTESSKGISQAAGNAGKASSDAMAKTSDGAKKAAGEVDKSTSALEKMQSRLNGTAGFADTLKEKFGAITATLTGGSIAGMAWLKAMDSASISDSIYRKLERKHVDTKRLQEFVAGANIDIGSGSDRLKIADTLLSRTKMKGPKMESFVQDTEKFFAMNSTDLARYGIGSSEDLANLLTKKDLSRSEKQFLKDYGLSTGGVSSRAKSLNKANEGVTEEDIIKANPLDVFNRRLGDFSSKMGKTMIGPMVTILGYANKIIDVINSIPGAPNLVSMGLALVSAAGAASLAISVFTPLTSAIRTIKNSTMLANAVEWASVTVKRALGLTNASLTVEEIMLTGATEAEALAMVESNAASNLSWGAKLKLAAANIYASVATRAHSIATMANSAITWASTGAMAALATIYGVLTGSISLTTVATWGLNTAMAILDALNPFTYIIAGAAILAGIIGIVAYKSGFLSTIWKDLGKIKFGKIFDELMKGDFSGAWKKLSKGMGNVWEDIKIGASLMPEEITDVITGKLTELVSWVTTSFPFLSKIFAILEKVYSIFEWIYSILSGFWGWIKTTMNAFISAFPGGKKAIAKDEWEAAMEKKGITYDEETGKYYKSEPTAITTWDDALQKWINFDAGHGEEVTPDQNILDLQAKYEGEKDFMGALRDLIPGAAKEAKRAEIEKEAEKVGLTFNSLTGKFLKGGTPIDENTMADLFDRKGTPIGDTETQKLKSLRGEWQKLPGFAEGVAQAVAKAISGIKIEGISTLVEKIQSLIDALANFKIPGVGTVGDVAKGITDKTSVVTSESKVYWPIGGGEPITAAEREKLKPGERLQYRYGSDGNPFGESTTEATPSVSTPGGIQGYRLKSDPQNTITPSTWAGLGADQKSYWEPFAVGVTFKKGGLFAGQVHAPEEIIPQATASRGPGPIARALDALDSVMSGRSSAMAAVGSSSANIHIHMPAQDFSGMRITSNVDFERLLERANKKAVDDAVEAVKKRLGQGRT